MSLHKLVTEREARGFGPAQVHVALEQSLGYLGDAIVRARAIQACDFDLRRLPVHRSLRWSVTGKIAAFFDTLSLDGAFVPLRASESVTLLSGPGVFVYAHGHDKGSYCSCWFSIWAESPSRAAEVAAHLDGLAGGLRLRNEAFTIDWQFTNAGGELRSASFQELGDPALLDEAYPSLGQSVREFISAYLDAPECVLILLGPPGTGKTRLVRAVLAELSRRKGENAEVMYTADRRALGTDEVFVDFITGTHDVFVIEDTDNLLKARASGNDEMHRFLAIADGVARSQGRKIIFTTNLPNVTDIDEALVRPGRCYAVKTLRSLDLAEASALARRLCGDDDARFEGAQARLEALGGRSRSVAQVYRAVTGR
jgi:hypothetical protein